MTGTLAIPDFFPEGVIARRMSGNDLIGDGIEDGDYLIIDPRREHEDGDIAVCAFTEKGIRTEIVRHVRHHGTMVVLEASNPVRSPVVVTPAGDPVIAGVVVGRLRRMSDRLNLVRRLK